MKKMTKELLVLLADKLKIKMSDEECDSFIKDFDIIQKQFALLSKVEGVDEAEPISLPYPSLTEQSRNFRNLEIIQEDNFIDKDFLSMNIVELHQALISGRITPIELTKLAIEKAKKDNNNALEYICEKEAIEEASKLDPSKKDNLLWGIPFVLKDNFYTKGMPTTGSTNLLNGFIPSCDSEVYLRLKNQGAILIGKTTMDELAMGGFGYTGHLGKTYNPWDPSHTHIIGGSSSGSASACAAGIVPFGIGSDTGDSARKPASYSNLVGLKPTWGRISKNGLIPFAPSLDTVGFFTRNIVDSSIVLSSLTNESFNIPNDGVKGLKIAVIDEIYNAIKNPTVKNAFEKVVEQLRQKGAIIEHVHLNIDLCRAVVPAYSILSNSEGVESVNSLEQLTSLDRSTAPFITVKRRLIIGCYSSLEENENELLLRARKYRHLINEQINKILKQYDAIYLPSTINTAPLFEEEGLHKLSDEYLIADNYLAIANFGGQPSLTLPLGFENGLPFGGNLIGKLFDEMTLLKIGKEIEDIVGLANRLPL